MFGLFGVVPGLGVPFGFGLGFVDPELLGLDGTVPGVVPAGGVALLPGGVADPAGAVVVPAGGVAVPAGGVADPGGGLVVLVGGVAVPAGGVAAPGVEL